LTLLPDHFGSSQNSLDDFLVASAATQVASEPISDCLNIGIWVLVQESVCVHDEAGGAKTALDSTMLNESLLNGMEFAITGDPFNRHDGFAIC